MATKSELYRKAASAAANYVKVASQRKFGKATAKQVVAAKKKYAAATKRLKASEAAEKKEAKKKAAKKKGTKKKLSRSSGRNAKISITQVAPDKYRWRVFIGANKRASASDFARSTRAAIAEARSSARVMTTETPTVFTDGYNLGRGALAGSGAPKKTSKKKASKKKVARRTTKIGDFNIIVESIWAEDIETGRRRVPRGHNFDWAVAEAKRGGRVKETGTARTKAEAEKKARVERRRLQAELDKKASKKKATKKKATKKKATKKKVAKKKVAKSSLTRSQIRTRNANTQKSVNSDIRKLAGC